MSAAHPVHRKNARMKGKQDGFTIHECRFCLHRQSTAFPQILDRGCLVPDGKAGTSAGQRFGQVRQLHLFQ